MSRTGAPTDETNETNLGVHARAVTATEDPTTHEPAASTRSGRGDNR